MAGPANVTNDTNDQRMAMLSAGHTHDYRNQ
jgi:hypothetical protein